MYFGPILFEIFQAGTYAYTCASAFHLCQILVENVRLHGARDLVPSVCPYQPSLLGETVLSSVTALALFASNGGFWWSLFRMACGAQVVATIWSETASEWALLYVAHLFMPSSLTYAPVTWALVNVVGGCCRGITLCPVSAASVAVSQVIGFHLFLGGRSFLACFFFMLASEVAIARAYLRSFGNPPKRYEGVPLAWHVLLEYVVGLRCVDAISWHEHSSSAPSCLPEAVRGSQWRCKATVLRARKLHTSRVVENGVQLPLAYWDEVAFAPTAAGAMACCLVGLRPPFTIVAEVVEEGESVHLIQKEVVFLLWPLPSVVTQYFRGTLSPGRPCPSEKCVFVPTRLTLRRATELLLTIFFLRHKEWW